MNSKKTVRGITQKIVKKVAERTATNCCVYIYHQNKVPNKLKGINVDKKNS